MLTNRTLSFEIVQNPFTRSDVDHVNIRSDFVSVSRH